MTVVFVAGTTAELIKIAPVMREMDARGLPYELWSTRQHVDGVSQTLHDLGTREPDRYLVSRPHAAGVSKVGHVPGWFLDVARTCLRDRKELARTLRGGIVLVHGDTFTTVTGALLGRLLGARVGHIEAGLRSGSLRSPFPEELNRRIVGMLTQIHFAPTERERTNLARRARRKGVRVLVTRANTVVDALRSVKEDLPPAPDLPPRFGLVTLHRFELVSNRPRYEAVLHRLKEFSAELPLVMVVGHSERARLEEYQLSDIFSDRFIPIEKRSYSKFLAVLLRAAMVVTDSGGLQEECAALGIPCAVHRGYTERHQGIGTNIVLTGLDMAVLDDFLATWEQRQQEPVLDRYHPSRMIVDAIEAAAQETRR